ncbi:hypothetical protein SDC9_61985 [bioreactor metagenome]|jgi:hypothetical protein|uniref:DUF1573 domain-containing protein n=1 Tax=bioreactor metagenome TaxID=1076179 RepID=A0A644XNG0_9ZZZZ|nr:DUF1573 domain-containing protein [Macellibacteroides fermentans]
MKQILFTLILFSIFFSCQSEQKEKEKHIALLVNEWQGKEIKFPKNLIFTRYLTDTIDFQIPQSEYKILVFVDSLGCTNCKLQLSKWKEFIAILDSTTGGSVPVIFFFQSKNFREIKYILKREEFDLPVIIDSNDELNNLNHFPNDLHFQSHLLDKNNCVKVIGNPVHNLKVRDLYLNTITKGGSEIHNPVLTTVDIPITEIDLGSFSKNETKEVDFIIKNIGNYPLFLKGTTSSCDCTTTESDRQQVPPKGELKLTIQYKPDQKGDFLRTVSVFINSTNSPIVLTITGTVR